MATVWGMGVNKNELFRAAARDTRRDVLHARVDLDKSRPGEILTCTVITPHEAR